MRNALVGIVLAAVIACGSPGRAADIAAGRRRPSCVSAATARAVFRRWRTCPRSRLSPISSFNGSSCSSAPAPARTSRCSPSSSSSTTRTSATSAPITPRFRRPRQPSPTTIRIFQKGRAGGRRPALRVMSHRYLRRHQGRRPRRRPARGIPREGAAGLQIGRAGRRRHGGDGGCRIPHERGRESRRSHIISRISDVVPAKAGTHTPRPLG